MDDIRLKKVGKQIQKDLSDIFMRLGKEEFKGKMISVTEVRVTPDLSLARVYISVFPSEKAQSVVDEIELMNKQIRFELGNRIRNQVRKIPELRFSLDITLDEMEKIDKLLKNE